MRSLSRGSTSGVVLPPAILPPPPRVCNQVLDTSLGQKELGDRHKSERCYFMAERSQEPEAAQNSVAEPPQDQIHFRENSFQESKNVLDSVPP